MTDQPVKPHEFIDTRPVRADELAWPGLDENIDSRYRDGHRAGWSAALRTVSVKEAVKQYAQPPDTGEGPAEPCFCDVIPHDRREHVASRLATGEAVGRAVASAAARAGVMSEEHFMAAFEKGRSQPSDTEEGLREALIADLDAEFTGPVALGADLIADTLIEAGWRKGELDVTKVTRDMAAAMPWYDEAFPDYSEAENVLRAALSVKPKEPGT